jgi:hypothetical protein
MLILALLGVRGIGLALAQMPAITAAFGAVRKAETGDAATIANIAQRIGGAAGATSVVLVSEQGTPTPHETLAFSLLIALAAVPILSACFLGSAKSE